MIFSRLPRGAPVMAAMCVLAALTVVRERSTTHIVPFFSAASDTRPQGDWRLELNSTLNFTALDNLHPVNQREFLNPVVDLGLSWSRYFDATQVSRRSVDRIPGEIEDNGAGRR